MNLGIFGGGFKPFNTGHYSKVLQAIQECDKVLVLWGLAGRGTYTTEIARKVYPIYRKALKRTHGEKVLVYVGDPSPISDMFAVIGDVAFGRSAEDSEILDYFGPDPTAVETVTVYAGEDDLVRFTSSLGSPKEEKYFGTLVRDGRLKFTSGDRQVAVKCLTEASPGLTCEEAEVLVNVRSTAIRQAMSSDPQGSAKFLPACLTAEEKDTIIKIVTGKST